MGVFNFVEHFFKQISERWRATAPGKNRMKLIFLFSTVTISFGFTYGTWHFSLPAYVVDNLNFRTFYLPQILCDNCTHFPFKYLIQNETNCDLQEDIFLLNIIISHHKRTKERNIIRQTWASVTEYKGYGIKTIIIFGRNSDEQMEKMLSQEANTYHDILQADFTEHYQNLTYKSIAALTWATNYCKQARFILKTDDDTFNHPHRIIDYLMRVSDDQFVGGSVMTEKPIRKKNKYRVDYRLYPHAYYPTFCAGPGYILSQTAAKALLAVHHNVTYVPMEDIYITGALRTAAGIPFTKIPGMVVKLTETELTECGLATWIKNKHEVEPNDMKKYWDRAKTADVNVHCTNERTFTVALVFGASVLWIWTLVHVMYHSKPGDSRSFYEQSTTILSTSKNGHHNL